MKIETLHSKAINLDMVISLNGILESKATGVILLDELIEIYKEYAKDNKKTLLSHIIMNSCILRDKKKNIIALVNY